LSSFGFLVCAGRSQLAQRFERCAEFCREKLRLFPRREVAALVDIVDKKLLYLFTADSFTAPATSDYELSKQAIHHEIEWFLATTFKGSETSHHSGIAVRFCGAVFDRLPRSPPYFLLGKRFSFQK